MNVSKRRNPCYDRDISPLVPDHQSPHTLGRQILDGAALALVIGSAVGSMFFRLPCCGRRLQAPIEEYGGAGWGCLDVPPAHDMVLALSECWGSETQLAYAQLVAWYEQIPDRVEKMGLWGEFAILLRGGRGQLVIERMGVFEDERRSRMSP